MANVKYPNKTARKKAQNAINLKYKKEKATAFTFRYYNSTDVEVIAKLKSVSNKCDYVRQLILKDIKEGN